MFDVSKIFRGEESKLIIDYHITLDKSYYVKTEIIDLKEIVAKGYFDENNNLYLEVKGEMILPDSRTLKEVEYPFSYIIDENIPFDSIYFKNSQNLLDLNEILWENTVLEIPIRVALDKDSNIAIKGEGWELTDKKKSNNPLAELENMIKKENE